MADLSQVLDALKVACAQNPQRKYYILIDRLDDRWVDESIKYHLINALFDTLKTFRKLDSLKIIVSVRSDVLEKSTLENKSIGFQRDKFGDINEAIKWDKKQLKIFVNRRINYLFRMKYTKQDVHFENIFPDHVGKVDTFEYMISRTLHRPRDILDFVNSCLKKGTDKAVVSVSDVRAAEIEYSKVRLQALGDEWRSLYPSVDLLLESIRGIQKSSTVKDILERDNFSKFVETSFDDFSSHADPISKAVSAFVKSKGGELSLLAGPVISCLYRIGVMGVKSRNLERHQWSYSDAPILVDSLISLDTRIRVHPMFYASLGINGVDQSD